MNTTRPGWKCVLAIAGLTTVGAMQLVVPLVERFPHLSEGHGAAAVPASAALNAWTSVPAPVADMLSRACNDCHSPATRWPWYASVAPAAWLIRDDVNHGRAHLDFAAWGTYPPAQQRQLLRNICDLSREHVMPPLRYVRLHRSAELTAADVDALCEWTLAALAGGRGSMLEAPRHQYALQPDRAASRRPGAFRGVEATYSARNGAR